jgi:hypothetical protein
MARGRQVRLRHGATTTADWAASYIPEPLRPEFQRGALLSRADLEEIADTYLALGDAQEDAGNKLRRGDIEAVRSGLAVLMDTVHEARDVLKRIPGVAEIRRARRSR